MAGYQGPQDGPGGPFWSRSCLAGAHGECGHLGHIGFGPGDGGRPAVTLMLCRCRCHSACALDGRLLVSRSIWVGLCDCPGTGLAEDRIDQAAREAPDFPDREHLLRKQRERQDRRAYEQQQTRAAMRAAWEATRAAAAGKSRAQIRESYVAELLARGVTVPSGLVLDAVADAIARNRDKISVVYGARVLAELGLDFWKALAPFTES
jgi:hypothetical protein